MNECNQHYYQTIIAIYEIVVYIFINSSIQINKQESVIVSSFAVVVALFVVVVFGLKQKMLSRKKRLRHLGTAQKRFSGDQFCISFDSCFRNECALRFYRKILVICVSIFTGCFVELVKSQHQSLTLNSEIPIKGNQFNNFFLIP